MKSANGEHILVKTFLFLRFSITLKVLFYFGFFLAAEIQSGLVEHDSLLLLSKTSAVVQGRFRRQR